MKARYILAMLCSTTLATAAQADDGNASTSSSSGSVNFTVYIPPLGAAIAAARDGAIGLWSISGRNNGLLLQLQETADGQGYTGVSVLSRAEVGVEAGWMAQGNGMVETGQNAGGLKRATFAVPADSAPVQTLLIRGI
jgi:hypothetical protein